MAKNKQETKEEKQIVIPWYKSKKLWCLAIYCAFTMLGDNDVLIVSERFLNGILLYIGAQGVADIGKHITPKK